MDDGTIPPPPSVYYMFKICVEDLVEILPLLYRSGREKMLLRLEEKC